MAEKTKPLIYLLGIILYISGIVSIYYYPKNAHNTYMSENALMPGTARVTFDYSDGLKITQFSNAFQKHLSKYNKLHGSGSDGVNKYERSKSCSKWIFEQLKDIGLECYIHKYSTNQSIEQQAYNIYSVLRAPKSDGRESILLSTSFNSSLDDNNTVGESIGISLTIFQYLHKKGTHWLAKDLILIISDSSMITGINGDTSNIGLKNWLEEYHSGDNNNYFPRAGAIQAAINIEANSKKYQNDHIYVLAEGSNGQLPNLDLINTIGRLAKREGYSKSMLLSSSSTTDKSMNWLLSYLPTEIKTLAIFMINQAIGIPTGDHGLFNKYHIDAVTLGVSGTSSTMGSRVLIGTIRSLNNLLERLHQSFYYYLLPSPFLYISIGEYMISLGLIISPLAFGVVYLLISLSNIFTSPTIFTVKLKNEIPKVEEKKKRMNLFEKLGNFKCLDTPKDIIYSFTIIAIFQIIGIALFSLPQTFTNTTTNLLIWLSNFEEIALFGSFILFYLIIFLVISPILDKMFYGNNQQQTPPVITTFKENSNNNSVEVTENRNVINLKSSSNSFFVFSNLPILIFITTMSLLNFSFCTFASILSIPLCFISHITNNSNNSNNSNSIKKIILLFKKLIVYILLLLFSPPILLYLFTHFILNDQNVFLFILTIINQYKQYSNLLFPFLTLIYIPLNLSILKSIK